ncbi:MAG: hypothetical protein IKS24_10055 [Bacteroidaceae bacterium]|nr:hypothetical protein [Bacteroidaceae bacterium]
MRKTFVSAFAAAVAVMLLAFTSCSGEIDSERQSNLSDETVSVTLSALNFDFEKVAL